MKEKCIVQKSFFSTLALLFGTFLLAITAFTPATFAKEQPEIVTLDWIISRFMVSVRFPPEWSGPLKCHMILSSHGKVRWEETRQLSLPTGQNPHVNIPWKSNSPYGLITLRVKISDESGALLDEKTVRCFRYLRPFEYPTIDSSRKIEGNIGMKIKRGGVEVFNIKVKTEKTPVGWESTMKGDIPFMLQTFMKKKKLFIHSKMMRLKGGLLAPTRWISKWKGGDVSVDYDLKSGFISRKTPFVRTVPKSGYDYLSMTHALRRISFNKGGPAVLFLLDRFSARELTFGKSEWYVDVNGITHKLIALLFRPAKILPHSSGQLVRLEVSRLISANKKKTFPGYNLDFDKTGNPISFKLGSFHLVFEKKPVQ